MSKFSIIFVVLVLFSFVKSEIVLADRLLIGIDFVGYGYIDDTNERKGKDVYFERCNLVDQEKSADEKTGDFETDECGDEGAREGSKVDLQSLPNVSLEIEFGKPGRWGVLFFTKFSATNRVKLINFPKDNETAEISHDIRFIGIPIFYTWGDPELGKNGKSSFRFGLGPQFMRYDPIIVKTKDKTYKKTINDLSGMFLYITWDWSWFSFNYVQTVPTSGIEIDDELTNDEGKPIKITTMWGGFNLNYSLYF